MTTLSTARLTLRKPFKTDAAALVEALNNLNVSRWTGRIPYPYGPTDAEAFLAHARDCAQDELVLLILREGELIGGIGVENGELGYWLAEPHWGLGYGREAARAVVDHAFMEGRRQLITACYFSGNQASKRILEGLGFAETGRGMCISRARQSEVAIVRLALTRAGWQDAKERQR